MDSLLGKIGEHLELSMIALLMSILIGIPIGVFASKRKKWRTIIIEIVNLLWTVPSIALFGMVIFIPFVGGTGYQPAIFVLLLYSTIPIIQNTHSGIAQIPVHYRTTAEGIGMNSAQVFWIIEMPIALPSIIRGIRLATITSISTATLACLVGAGGLGNYIFLGLQTQNTILVLQGALPAILMTLLGSSLFKFIEKKMNNNVFLKLYSYQKYRYVGYFVYLLFLSLILLFFIDVSQQPFVERPFFKPSNMWPAILNILYSGRLWEHLEITITIVGLAALWGIPFAIWSANKPNINLWVSRFLETLQSIPSPALFGLTIVVPWIGGVGYKAAMTALFLYAIIPIIRETSNAVLKIPPYNWEVSESLGMTSWQILRIVKFPLVFPSIMKGIQRATVTTICLTAIAAMIGSGGLGTFIYYGIRNGDSELIFVGSLFMVLLAVIASKISEKLLSKTTGNLLAKSVLWKKYRILGFSLVTILFAVSIFPLTSYLTSSQNNITVATKNFTESHILAEILKQYLESHNSDLNVSIKNYEGSILALKALQIRDADMYVEYTGTAHKVILKKTTKHEREELHQKVQNAFKEKYNLIWMPRLGFENSYALAVSEDTARKIMNFHGLKEITELKTSHLVPLANEVTLGCRSEFMIREDCLLGLQRTYNFVFSKLITSELRYQLLASGQSDVIEAYTTDGQIKQLKLILLKDDRNYFPAYEAAPVIHKNVIRQHPKIKTLLEKLEGKISTTEMCEMNYFVDIEKKKISQVARDFLHKKHLLKQR